MRWRRVSQKRFQTRRRSLPWIKTEEHTDTDGKKLPEERQPQMGQATEPASVTGKKKFTDDANWRTSYKCTTRVPDVPASTMDEAGRAVPSHAFYAEKQVCHRLKRHTSAMSTPVNGCFARGYI